MILKLVRYQDRFAFTTFAMYFLILTLLCMGSNYVTAGNDSESKNYDKMVNDIPSFVIKYNTSEGFSGMHYDYILYNSSDNLLSSHSLLDKRLSFDQLKNLTQLVMDSDFFNISFEHNKPQCCDLIYHTLEVKSANKTNSVTWDDSELFMLPPIIMKIVDTLEEYKRNSTSLG